MAKKKENTTSIGFEEAIWKRQSERLGVRGRWRVLRTAGCPMEGEIKKQLDSIGFGIE